MTVSINFEWFAIYVAINTLILLLLGMNISRLRIKHKVSNGDGDCRPLMKAIRAHANGVEHSVLYGMAILAMALLGLNAMWLSILVMAFSVSRILHAHGMLNSNFTARRVGAGITFLLQGVSVIIIGYLVLSA